MKQSSILVVILGLLALSNPVNADEHTSESAAANDRMEAFREAKYGMFIHWGLYAILNTAAAASATLAPKVATLGKVLSGAGYKTAQFGKLEAGIPLEKGTALCRADAPLVSRRGQNKGVER